MAGLAIALTLLAPASAIGQSDDAPTPRPAPGSPTSVPMSPSGPSRGPDFNGDGYADLAIGAPHARAGRVNAGEVHVLYGSPKGLSRATRQVWGQDSPGIGERAEHGDQFGWSVSAGDYDADGFTDLAIGARFEDRGARDAGIVHVLYGSAEGLRAERSQLWNQASPGVRDKPGAGDQFGWSLASGDFDGDGDDELVIGVHHEDHRVPDAGIVHVLRGTPNGLTGRRSQVWHQASPGMPETPEDDDQFGRTLAVADFDGDGHEDLAIGSPYEDRAVDRAGVVHVLHGSPGGLRAGGVQLWHQDAPGIAERAQRRDQFGQSLVAADFDGDGFGDLAAGVWFEDYHNKLSNEGGFHVIYGSSNGLSSKANEFWHEGRRGVRDRAQISDRFGQALTAGDFNGDGRDDLAVGAPSSDLGKGVHENRGAVHVFPGSRAGIGPDGDRVFTQASRGVPNRPEVGDHFGEALAAADFDGDGYVDLAVGIPHEDRATRDDGAVYVMPGSPAGLTARRDQLIGISRVGLERRPRIGALFGWAMAGEHSHSGVPRTADPDV